MPLEFQTVLPPTSSEFQSKKPPLSLGIPRCRPWYGYFLKLPNADVQTNEIVTNCQSNICAADVHNQDREKDTED